MYQQVINFWFDEIDKSRWWTKDEHFDHFISHRFVDVYKQATRCELFAWRKIAEGRLAEIIVLDQFSRNMYRDSLKAFAYDPLALALAQEAVAVGADQMLSPIQKGFLYMPFMHSESPLIHAVAIDLYEKIQLQSFLDFEIKHQAIITQFGRYPHRNAILGRASTPEELAFLKLPDSSF